MKLTDMLTTLERKAFFPSFFLSFVPNVVVEWLKLLRFREVTGSDLSPETGYPDWVFVVFSVPPGEFLDITLKLGHDLNNF
jgi:hypothetical protein